MKMAHLLGIILPAIIVLIAPYTTAQNHEAVPDPDYTLLPLGSCSQSSVFAAVDTHNCSSAITNTLPLPNTHNKRCSHVGNENGWWSAKTTRPAHITKVRIFNRVDCCQERLNDFVISVDGVECARHKSDVTFLEKTFDCIASGQEVKISSNREYLTLCKVEVIGAYVYSLMPLRSCNQSSVFASEGNCHGAITYSLPSAQSTTCSHVGNAIGWWSATTIRPAHIKIIRILNRASCCQERLNDFAISVDGVVCARHKSNVTFLEKDFDCIATGEEVKISSNKEFLTLCKVEVFGEFADTLLPLIGCHQSSVLSGGPCSIAIYKTLPIQSSHVTGCSHVGNEKGWWSAKTIRPAHITKVRIFNRVDCCQERLNDFVISVDGVECARHKSNVTFLEKTFDCIASGQEVKISSNMVYLTLCKVEVFGEFVDTLLPLIGCHQSSVADADTCSKAIVNTLPIQSALVKRCSHVLNENGWWSAKTTRAAHITKVRIFNRVDCCQERLNDFVISVDGVECARHKSNVTFLEKTFDCVATGQEVKISSNRVYLTLCKVEVFGEYVDQRSSTYQYIDGSCRPLNVGLMGADWHVTVNSQSQCEKRCTKQLHCKYYSFRYHECTLSGRQRNMNFRKAVHEAEKCLEFCIDSKRFCMVHRRLDKSVSLNKIWTEYEAGFGNPQENFWFGLRWLNLITSKSSNLTFRVMLIYPKETKVADYSGFVVGNASQNYRMNYQSFDAVSSQNVPKDILLANKGRMFSTMDRDNDNSSLACSTQLYDGAGWWFGDCTHGISSGKVTSEALAQAIDSAPWYGPLNIRGPQVFLLIQKPE